MIALLKQHNRYNETMFLGIMSIFCFCFSIFRFLYTDTRIYLFLNWNLFLAFIPWILSTFVILKPKLQNKLYVKVTVFCTWLIFFPNAPYILTDLFHLRSETSMPIWYDLVLILFFAWVGLMFGFLSLWDIELMISRKIKRVWISVLSSGLMFLVGFGIYLGRFLRWNSWDILKNPIGLLYDISDRIINPFEHPRAWGMTIFMGLLLNMIYWSLKLIKLRKD